jgi:predicted aldo/keto reductase-like oxidoreductase
MGVDHVDLLQLHNLVEPQEWEVAHGPGGALEAMLRARDEGLVRHLGVTGHGLRIAGMHLRSLERFDYDSVLFPFSYTLMRIPEYRRDVETLLRVCAERDVAVQTIKAIARRRWGTPAGYGEARQSWYEPMTDPSAIARAVQHVLARPQLFLASPSALEQLPDFLAAAAAERADPDEQLLEADVLRQGLTPLFDGAGLERI